MQSGAIEEIRKAEQNADDVISRAYKEAVRIREDAARQAAEDDRSARLAAENIVASMLEVAGQQAERAGEEARKALEKEMSALKAQAESRQSVTVERILRLIGGR